MKPPGRALITGASSGIGTEFARLLAAEQRDLIITARREERLATLREELCAHHDIQVEVIPCDLSAPQGPAVLYDAVKQRQLTVTTLINNAGFGVYGHLVTAEGRKIQQMLQLNIQSLTELTQLFARDMRERGGGAILLVGSMAGYRPLPSYAAYAASKAYVISFGEALHYELRDAGIVVTTLNPGLTQTEFFKIAGFPRSTALDWMTHDAHRVAQIGLRALRRKRVCVIPGFFNNVTSCLNRWMPWWLSRPLVARVMRK